MLLGYDCKTILLQLYYSRSLSARDVKHNDSSSYWALAFFVVGFSDKK